MTVGGALLGNQLFVGVVHFPSWMTVLGALLNVQVGLRSIVQFLVQ